MATGEYDKILKQAKIQLTAEERQRLARELSAQLAVTKCPPARGKVTDPREQRKGPATTEFGRRLRELRKQHLADGGRLLNMDEIDELVAQCQGPDLREE